MRGRKGAAAIALSLSGLLAVSASAVAAGGGRADSGTIYAATTHSAGGYTYSAGQGHDKLLGAVAITYRIKVRPTAVGTFHLTAKPVVEYVSGGSMSGTVSATLIVTATGAETITNGKVSLKHGVGTLRGHSFKGTFTGYGSATANELVIHYKGRLR